MIKRKNIVTIIFVTVTGLILLANPGCKKCYKCARWIGSFKCIKGMDTIRLVYGNRPLAVDSLNYYRGQGYTCDTGIITYNPLGYLGPICGKRNYDYAIQDGSECDLIR